MVRTRHSDIEIDLAADGAAREAVAELSRGDGSVRLEAANRLRHATEALVTELVADARASGATWADIGEILGVSTQAAHQKYRWSAADSIESDTESDAIESGSGESGSAAHDTMETDSIGNDRATATGTPE